MFRRVVHSVIRGHAVLTFSNLHFRVGVHGTDQALVLSVLQILRGRAVKHSELSRATLLAERAVSHELRAAASGGVTSGGAGTAACLAVNSSLL